MILPKEQINRYLRHIIMSEISGHGQKKIIEASVFILADNVRDASALVYYLSASGVGHISCCFINTEDSEKLFEDIRDLNPNCLIELVDIDALNGKVYSNLKNFTISVVLLNKYSFLGVLTQYPNFILYFESISTILALHDGWKGVIQFIDNKDQFLEIYSKLEEQCRVELQSNTSEKEGSIFTASILGAVSVVEVVKHVLNIGEKLAEGLFIDLLLMKFSKDSDSDFIDFFSNTNCRTADESEKSQPVVKSLSEYKVLLVGAGGLGSPAALALANAGIGTIGFVDYDRVEVSNLNRQIMHSTSRIGMTKVESAKVFIKKIGSDINVITHDIGLNRDNVMSIISDYDVIIDGVDNFPTRYLLNDACFFARKPMIEAGAIRFIGFNMTIVPNKGACYRCVFPSMPDASRSQTCSEVGVLGPVPGIMGFIQAAETAKLLLGKGVLLVNKIMYFDALELDFDVIDIEKRNQCSLCGNRPSITKLEEYEFSCMNMK